MRQRLLSNLAALAVLSGACANAALAPAPEPTPSGVTLTPVVVEPDGRMTPKSEPLVRSVEPISAEPAALAEAEGEATYYASRFDGRRAASGVVFRNSEPYAAHRTYPFGTVVRVTNLVNDRSVIVRIIDRGPHGTSARAKRTIIDVSQSVARELDFMRAGRIPVRIEVLEWGTGKY
jgi:rare lipoprotein A